VKLDITSSPRANALVWRGISMCLQSVEGNVATAQGVVHEKPHYDIHDGGDKLVLGVSGLPCNASIVEPVTVYTVTFCADRDLEVVDGKMVLPDDLKFEATRE
jgi:hypothetical protein